MVKNYTLELIWHKVWYSMQIISWDICYIVDIPLYFWRFQKFAFIVYEYEIWYFAHRTLTFKWFFLTLVLYRVRGFMRNRQLRYEYFFILNPYFFQCFFSHFYCFLNIHVIPLDYLRIDTSVKRTRYYKPFRIHILRKVATEMFVWALL